MAGAPSVYVQQFPALGKHRGVADREQRAMRCDETFSHEM
jgi:hypothetical protein